MKTVSRAPVSNWFTHKHTFEFGKGVVKDWKENKKRGTSINNVQNGKLYLYLSDSSWFARFKQA